MELGFLRGAAIYLGGCGALCVDGFGFKRLFADVYIPSKLDVDQDVSFDVSADDFPQGLSQNVQASKIFGACAAKMRGSIIKTDKTFTHLVDVTLGLGFVKADGYEFNGSAEVVVDHDWWANYTVPVQVTCKALDGPKLPSDVAFDHGEFKVKDIKLFLSTYSNAVTKPNPATTCKKGQIKVRLTASKAGNAKFNLWTKIGNGAMTSKVIDAWAFHDGNGGFEAEHVEWVSVNKTTFMQAKAEEMVSAFGKSTPWKDITLQCKSGGFATDTSDYKATASLLISDTGGNRCPRPGQVGFTFKANYSFPIKYRLTCNNGIDQTGSLQPTKSGADWKAQNLVLFQTKKTQFMGCALKLIRNGKTSIAALANKQFICKTRAVDTGSDELVQDTNRDEPLVPPAKYDGELTIADSALVKRNQCPRQGQVVFKINSNRSNAVSYRLDGSNGQSWTGTVQMFPKGPGKYQGVGAKTFNVSKTENITYALKRVKGNKAYVLDFRAMQFTCIRPNVETGSNDIKVAPKPNTGSARVPATPNVEKVANGIKVAPKPNADAAAKRKREADATKRKREADAKKRKRKADATKRKREADAEKRKREAAIAKRKAAAAALARRKAKLKKRRTSSNSTAARVMRLR